MLENFRGLKIKGRCFKNETTLEFFKNNKTRVSLVFGRNGAGKSTVSKTFAKMQNWRSNRLDDVEYSAISECNMLDMRRYIAVFNEQYIQEKLGFSSDRRGLGALVLFGRQNKIEAELKDFIRKEKRLRNQLFLPGVKIESYLRNIIDRTGYNDRLQDMKSPFGMSFPFILTSLNQMSNLVVKEEDEAYLRSEFKKKVDELTGFMDAKDGFLSPDDTQIVRRLRASLNDLNRKLTKLELEKLNFVRNKMHRDMFTIYAWAKTYEKMKRLKRASRCVDIAADKINETLAFMFMSRDRLSIAPSGTGNFYRVMTNGHQVRSEDISIGERNALALAYFFSEIVDGEAYNELSKVEKLIILDDPISSFDHEHKISVVSYIKHEMSKLSSSRFICLTHDLHSYTALASSLKAYNETKLESRTPIEFETYCLTHKTKTLENLNLEQNNEYHLNFAEVFEYATLGKPDGNIHAANQMRRILEAYSTFVYRKGIEYLFYGELIQGKDAHLYNEYFKTYSSRFIVNDESHFQGRVKSMIDGNNLYDFIYEEERHRAIREAICLLYLLNPEHVLASLFDKKQKDKDYKVIIERWLKDIREYSPFTAPQELETYEVSIP